MHILHNHFECFKGLGYAEMEWAILYQLGVIDQSTTVITTVHEAQIVSDEVFGQNLQADHDLPVDIIVTPRRIINVKPRMAKPSSTFTRIFKCTLLP